MSARDEALTAVSNLATAVADQQQLLEDLASAVTDTVGSAFAAVVTMRTKPELLRRLEHATERVLPGGPW